MWFRNLQIYRLPENWGLTAEALAEKLAAHPFQPCGSQDMASRGWTSPTKDDRFVMAVGGQFLIALAVEQKLLPSSVVNEVAADKAEIIEAQQGFKPGRKQMKEIKEAVLQELLPRAFTRRRTAFAWINPIDGWLVVDASSPARAEEILDALRDSLDELPVKMVKTQLSPVSVMTDWLLANQATGNFTIDLDCELRAVTDEKAAVRYVRHALDGKDVQDHLAAGKLPTRLAMTFDDRISIILTEKMEIKRVAFLDIIKEEAERQGDAADMQMEADFALMSGELSRLIPALLEVLGGEVKDAVI
ncbi:MULTISPECIES: recombination-associated protein RdgC [Zoogloea]|jgi:recombination associated protein RdgC|uniref:recombination-associated protein RdgC n=1 Tax=Zoogloea TaxID=349 RepID=UPI001B7B2751|nr:MULTISPECIES: recombination-associated protein RdgC [Zoogloea]MBP8134005.1 recombination-associated protein RdgC [Zoogloea sp.]MBT9499351.1 recombination-associated protein RdgC [Zoogloea sp.]MDD2670187.1 recombination-associated protein RdgC [Zoogloea sp.]MDY0034981.1 recombination-associated protein RdgC [Zoogloea oleivorans]